MRSIADSSGMITILSMECYSDAVGEPMDISQLRAYILAKPGAVEDYPFGPEDLTAKVGGKIFAFVHDRSMPPNISLKCEPTHVQYLRETYPAITTAPYLSKIHWNKIVIDGSIPDDELVTMIEESYRLVVASLTRAQRADLKLQREL
jgi:predicted DNA-binding protein (MmcQ/YjbR family)